MIIKVEVIEQDILDGVRRSSRACPVALAMKRVTGKTWYIGRTEATQYKDSDSWDDFEAVTQMCNLPFNVQQWISDFDQVAGLILSFKPFSFYVEVMP